MSDITFRKYQIGDEKGLTLLARAVFGSHFAEDYWKWKYIENPLQDNFSYVAAWNDDIVGFVGAIPWRLIVMGKEVVGGQVTDMMVHPEWREKGIFLPINRKNLEEIKAKTSLHYGFSNPLSYRIYRKLFHYEGFHPLKMEKVINIKSLAWQALKQRKGFNFSRLVNLISKMLSSKMILPSKNDKQLRTNLVVRRIDQFDDRFNELWEKVHTRLNIATIRDSKYLNWRYIRHPEFHYTILGAEEDGTLSGFLVVRCEKKEGVLKGLIIDLLVDPDKEMTASCLISESLKFFRSQKVTVITTWIFEHHPIYNLLRKNGFSARPSEKVVILIKSFSQDIPSNYLSDSRNWYLTMGDCEIF